jgi:hypothetical protein
VPAELGSLAGSLAGIRELIAATGNQPAQPAGPRAPQPAPQRTLDPAGSPRVLTPPSVPPISVPQTERR